MSMHKSLIPKEKFGGRRSVLRRAERIVALQKGGKWQDGQSVFGLPKLKVVVVKQKKKAEEKTEAAAAAPGAAAPAAGAAPAAAPAAAKPEAGKKAEKK